jgi:hypothetical protein
MAQLILTDAEREAGLWTDCDDAALGALLRKQLALLQTAEAQLDKTRETAAALLLCCNAAEAGANELRSELFGVTQGGQEFGDWVVTATRKPTNPPNGP